MSTRSGEVQGVRSAFAVVMADAASVREYARREEAARSGREKAAREDSKRRDLERETSRAAAVLASGSAREALVAALVSAANGHFDAAALQLCALESDARRPETTAEREEQIPVPKPPDLGRSAGLAREGRANERTWKPGFARRSCV